MANNKQILRTGVSGEAVSRLHEQLIQLGFEVEARELERQYFGRSTRAAVEAFQKAHNLQATGEVDERTMTSLREAQESAMQMGDGSATYIVQRGDNLNVIAARFGTTVAAIVRRNNIEDPDLIFPDQRLIIPQGEQAPDETLEIAPNRVAGAVKTDGGAAVQNVLVQAFDKKLGNITSLGKATTNDDGYYEIEYASELVTSESAVLDIFVQVNDANGQVIARSDLLINAPSDARIYVTVSEQFYRPPSEYEALEKAISTLIKPEETVQLEQADIEYIAAKLNRPLAKVVRFVHAWRLAIEARAYLEVFAVPVEVIYGVMRDDTLPAITVFVNSDENSLKEALHQAIANNIVALHFQNHTDTFVSQIKTLATTIADHEPENPDVFSVRRLMGILDNVPPNVAQAVVRKHTRHIGRLDSLLNEVNDDPETSEFAQPIREIFTLSELTHQNLSLITELAMDMRDENLKHINKVSDFARVSTQDWRQYLVNRDIRLPLKAGSDRNYTVDEYAQELAVTFKQKYPTVAFINTLENRNALPSEENLRTAFVQFFEDNPEFNITQISLDRYLAESGLEARFEESLQTAPDETSQQLLKNQQERLKAELRSWQRVYKLLPDNQQRDEYAVALRSIELETDNSNTENGTANKIYLDSALKIATMKKTDFVARWEVARKNTTTSISQLRREGETIYQRAQTIAFAVNTTAWNHSAALQTVNPAFTALPALPPHANDSFSPDIVNLTTLFGQQNYCESKHCQSLLGPAAYLADLYNTVLNDEGRNIFGFRRPDILNLHLNCQNTETKLPYIDLVNELLEGLIVDNTNRKLQTTHTEQELALRPEHEELEAYLQLATALYPISLPWDKWYEEARLYLDYIDLPLHHLIDTFIQPQLQGNGFESRQYRLQQLRSQASVQAVLGLTSAVQTIITGTIPKDLEEIFGLTHNDVAEARKFPVFMRQLGLWKGNQQGDNGAEDFVLARQILETRYLQDSSTIPLKVPITIQGDNTPCDYNDTVIDNMTTDSLVRIVKFERLRRALGWQPHELHHAMMVYNKVDEKFETTPLPTDTLNQDFLRHLSHMFRLQALNKGISFSEMLSWWGNIGTDAGLEPLPLLYEEERMEPRKSLYDRVFLDISLFAGSTKASAQKYFELNDQRDELLYKPIQSITDHKAIISAALSLSEDDLTRLMDFVKTRYTQVTDKLTLGNLSALYRMVSLAHYLNLTIREMIIACSLIDIEPFEGVHDDSQIQSEYTVLFVEAVRRIQHSGFSIRDLAYLWQHYTEGEGELTLIHKRINDYLKWLRTELDQGITLEQDSNRLLTNWDELVSVLKQIGVSEADVRDLKEIIEKKIHDTRYVAPVIARCFTFLDYEQQSHIVDLLTNHSPSATGRTYQEIIKELMSALRYTHFFSQALSDFLDIPQDTLKPFLLVAFRSTSRAICLLSDLMSWARHDNSVDDEVIHEHLQRLEKIAWIIRQWQLSPVEVEYITNNSSDFYDFAWNRIPIAKAATAMPSYQQWAAIDEYVAVRQSISKRKDDVIDLLKLITERKNPQLRLFISQLAGLLHLEPIEVRKIIDKLGYGQASSSSNAVGSDIPFAVFRNAETLRPVIELAHLVHHCGRSVEVLHKWVKIDAIVSNATDAHQKSIIAAEIRNAVQAQCNEKQWQQVARDLQDRMRIVQRDRLLSFLTERVYDVETGTGAPQPMQLSEAMVYDWLLIDPLMNPCMDTTRLKQAISSIQLFIHQNLMSLQDNISVFRFEELEELREQWEWMKTYRIWEAFRKVFLYPENWIEPELRDNKTPFFEELESELAQSELTEKFIGKAFTNYLRKLDEVAKLEMIATYQEPAGDFHLVGRTSASPHQYYYRKLTKEKVWTPWEKISVDIEGDHIYLIKFQGLLHLFWARFKESKRRLGKDNPDDRRNDKKNYLPYYEIKLAWTTYEDGFWTTKHETREPIEFLYSWTYHDFVENPLTLIKFEFRELNNELLVKAYAWGGSRTPVKAYDWDDTELDFFFEEVKRKLESNELDSTLTNIYPWSIATFQLTKDTYRKVIDTYHLSIKKILHRDDGVSKAINWIKKMGKFPIFYYYHPSGSDPLHEHKVSWDLLRNLGLGYDPTNETDFKDAFDYTVKTYYYLKASEQTDTLLAGDRQWFPLYQIGEFRFSNCDFAPKSIRYLGEKSFILNQETLLKVVLPYKTRPYTEKLLKTTKNILGITDIESATLSYKSLLNAIHEDFEIIKSDWVADSARTVKVYSGKYLDKMFVLDYPPFIFQTTARVYFVDYVAASQEKYVFKGHFHPFVCDFRQKLLMSNNGDYTRGFDELLSLETQQQASIYPLADYSPSPTYVANLGRKEIVDFDIYSPYGLYNWEIFFHVPFTIAVRLSQNKQFDKAQRWFHYIFNPVAALSSDKDASKYWNVLPLHELGKPSNILFEDFASEQVQSQLAELAKNPFQPHRIAQQRLGAYQKAIVMKYLDNLIAWGDHLFERDTIESINEATHLYILGAKILGEKPKVLPRHRQKISAGANGSAGHTTITDIINHNYPLELVEGQMMMSADVMNAGLVSSKSSDVLQTAKGWQWYYHPSAATSNEQGDAVTTLQQDQPVFSVPHNEHLLSYWDKVADRLFKIRNCRNIEGLERELPIFEPPIDPGLLVRGHALDIDISDLLSDLYAPLPPYRFRVMLQKAYEFCGDVRSLGGALLAALEKQDAEELALLRSSHEQEMLRLAEIIKQQQIRELRENLKSSSLALEMAAARFEYYSSRPFANRNEKAQVAKLNTAHDYQLASQILSAAAAVGSLLPQIHVPTTGTPSFELGGIHFGQALSIASQVVGIISSIYSHEANMHSIQASWERRMDDWQFQARQARKEMQQLEKQVLATEIRIEIAERELENHRKQQEQAEEIATFMKSKFTNKELYHWMSSQLSTLYFQTYRMAVDLAKMAQKCYRYEMGDDTATYISSGHWDNLKKGLLAGDKLQFELRRMEEAYLRGNTRELELTKNISLKALDPIQLDNLRYTRECEFTLPELLFDLDYPGHYYRRIKSLSISIPSVVGPYSGVSCTLQYQSSYTRIKPELGDTPDVYRPDAVPQNRKIALSSAQSDGGVFELNPNDERYLPFELCGVISTWKLEFPSAFDSFDHSTISDVIIHLRYTASVDATLQTDVKNRIENSYAGEQTGIQLSLMQRLDVRREFPELWHKLRSDTVDNHELPFELSKNHFPYLLRPMQITVKAVSLYCELGTPLEGDETVQFVLNGINGIQNVELVQLPLGAEGRTLYKPEVEIKALRIETSSHLIIVDSNTFPTKKLKELILMLHYEVSQIT